MARALVIGEVAAADVKALQALGDALREQLGSGVGAARRARSTDGKGALLAVVTDDLRERGVRADAIVRDVAALAGGRGGGKPHMAQAGIPDAARLDAALAAAPRHRGALVGARVTVGELAARAHAGAAAALRAARSRRCSATRLVRAVPADAVPRVLPRGAASALLRRAAARRLRRRATRRSTCSRPTRW